MISINGVMHIHLETQPYTLMEIHIYMHGIKDIHLWSCQYPYVELHYSMHGNSYNHSAIDTYTQKNNYHLPNKYNHLPAGYGNLPNYIAFNFF